MAYVSRRHRHGRVRPFIRNKFDDTLADSSVKLTGCAACFGKHGSLETLNSSRYRGEVSYEGIERGAGLGCEFCEVCRSYNRAVGLPPDLDIYLRDQRNHDSGSHINRGI